MTAYALRLENNTDTAARVRMADLLGLQPAGLLTARSGVRPDGGGAVTVQAGTMNVQVTAFAAWVQGGVSVVQGGYTFVSDATATLAITAGHASLPRIDTIVARVRDNAYDGSGTIAADVFVVAGTPAASPAAPALPANSVPLRDVNVPAGLSTGNGGLQNSHLSTDRRRYLTSLGGIVPVSGQAERDALFAYSGLTVYRKDLKSLETFDGTAWPASDTAPTAFPYASGWSDPAGFQPGRYWRRGGRVFVDAYALRGGSAAAAGATVGTLPSGFWPPAQLPRVTVTNSGGTYGPQLLSVSSAGVITAGAGVNAGAAIPLVFDFPLT